MEWSISYEQFSAVSHPQTHAQPNTEPSHQANYQSDSAYFTAATAGSKAAFNRPGTHNTSDGDCAFVRAVAAGNFNVGCHRNLIQEVLSQPFWQDGMGVLMDFRLADFRRSDLNAMISLCDIHIDNNATIGRSRIAILVSNDLAYGSVRQFLLLVADKVAALFKLTRDLDDAIAWLRS